MNIIIKAIPAKTPKKCNRSRRLQKKLHTGEFAMLSVVVEVNKCIPPRSPEWLEDMVIDAAVYTNSSVCLGLYGITDAVFCLGINDIRDFSEDSVLEFAKNYVIELQRVHKVYREDNLEVSVKYTDAYYGDAYE